MMSFSAQNSVLHDEHLLERDLHSSDEEFFLSLMYTHQSLIKLGQHFFELHDITDAQFNLLMVLWDYRDRSVTQTDISDLLLINRASVGGLIDRLEKRNWVKRVPVPGDRRANHIEITDSGSEKLKTVKKPYYQLMKRAFVQFDEREKELGVKLLAKLRTRVFDMSKEIKAKA